MSITTIGALYTVGAVVGAFRGFYYLQEHKAEIVNAVKVAFITAKEKAVAQNSASAEFLNDETLELAGAAIRGMVYTTVITTHTFAWPVIALYDIYEDVKVAFA